jgi:structural maintenance of chromosomes protein 5
VSIDGEGSPRSSANKRPRLDYDPGEEEVSEPENSELLPDSFRRSPKGKQRAANVLENGHQQNEHQPGSIVRVTLTTFVTYTKAEFHPGPNLNMIIGPNGTGKSTLVCAICLGLGWATSHLGRAKDLGEFVKHGAKRAVIEIELAGDPTRHAENQVITTTIVKEGNKAEYAVNGKKSNKKGVQLLARSFSIQVDNLCQFLPQDRVVEFAALSPVDLLTQTQRAAAPEEMSEWHDSLKSLRKEQKGHEQKQQSTIESLKADEHRQKSQAADVERLRERTDLLQRSAALEKLRPFPQYQAARTKFNEAKAREKEASKELRHLEQRLEPNMHAVRDKENYWVGVGKMRDRQKRLVERHEGVVTDHKGKIDTAHAQVEELLKEIATEKKVTSGTKLDIQKHQQDLLKIRKAMQNPPEQVDFAELNEKIRAKQREIREFKDKADDIKGKFESLKVQGRQRADMVRGFVTEKENLQSQAGQQESKLRQASRDTAAAWKWIQANKEIAFKTAVYAPPIISCKVDNSTDADIVESVIPDGDKLAFTVTSHEDFKMLQEQLYDKMGLSQINIRNSMQPLSSFRAPLSQEQLQQHGLHGWVLDLLDGPDEVRAMLCDNRNIHQTAYARREISSNEYTTLQRSPVSSWVTPTHSYQMTRRREYGDQATSTRVQALKRARFFTDTPVDHQANSELDRRINQVKSEIHEIEEEMKALQAEGAKFASEHKQVVQEEKTLREEKDSKQRALSAHNGLPVKEQHTQEKLDDAQKLIDGHRERLKRINDKIDDISVVKGQHCLDYANSVESMRSLYIQLYEQELMQIEAKSDLDQLKFQHAEEERLLGEKRKELDELRRQKNELREAGRVLGERCKVLGDNLDEYEAGVQNEIYTWEPEKLETEIQSVQARLEMAGATGNENTIREFEQRAKRIEQKWITLKEIEATLADLDTKITDIRGRWEPRLDALISEISEAFADNFTKIQCAGEVTVHKDDDFEQWSIEIKVKFRCVPNLTYITEGNVNSYDRENEQLSVLDSHRQSGGERAVSTIFYLMALQSLARAPFRVVDEINQGMDPRNERLVHSRMVDIACAEHTSQYFLITPKLLNGLKYHPNMKVHCIASGEYMPTDHRELNFEMLAQKALALKAVG